MENLVWGVREMLVSGKELPRRILLGIVLILLTFSVLSPQAHSGGTILFDNSHGEKKSVTDRGNNGLSKLKEEIEAMGYEVRVARERNFSLEGVKALVIVQPTAGFSQEARRIRDFVYRGGILIVLSDPDPEGNRAVNSLSREFEVTFSGEAVIDPIYNDGDPENILIRDLLLGREKREVTVYEACYLVSGPSQLKLKPIGKASPGARPSSATVFMEGTLGKGRVIFGCDSDFLTNRRISPAALDFIKYSLGELEKEGGTIPISVSLPTKFGMALGIIIALAILTLFLISLRGGKARVRRRKLITEREAVPEEKDRKVSRKRVLRKRKVRKEEPKRIPKKAPREERIEKPPTEIGPAVEREAIKEEERRREVIRPRERPETLVRDEELNKLLSEKERITKLISSIESLKDELGPETYRDLREEYERELAEVEEKIRRLRGRR